MQARRGRGTGSPRVGPLHSSIKGREGTNRQLRVYVLLALVAVGGIALLRSVYSVTMSSTAPKPPPRVVSLVEPSPPPPAEPERSVVEEVERIAELIQETLGLDHLGGLHELTPADDGYINAAYQIAVSRLWRRRPTAACTRPPRDAAPRRARRARNGLAASRPR